MPAEDTSRTYALDALRDELLAIPAQDLLPVNVDVAAAALVVLGAAPEIRTHHAALVALVGDEMASVIDRLDVVARAALQAHSTLRSLEEGADIPALSRDVVKAREVLVAVVRMLITRGLVPASVLRELQGAHGFRNQCVDVLLLTSLLEERWSVVGPHTGLSLEDVHRAEASTNALATAVGIRNQASRSPVAEMRQRAFTLLARTYNEARRLIAFLRWNHGDADRIAPSFQSRRIARRRKGAEPGEDVLEPALTDPLASS